TKTPPQKRRIGRRTDSPHRRRAADPHRGIDRWRASMARRVMITIAAAAVALSPVAAGATTEPAVSRQDRTFLIQAHQGNLAEIQAGEAALKSTTKKIRDVGEAL